MIKTDQNNTTIPGQESGFLSLENTKIAFSSKSDAELKRAYWLFKLIASPFIMICGKYLTIFALKVNLPIKGMIKKTIFKQFCGGETIAECAKTTQILDKYNVGTILDYSVEGKNDRETFEATCTEILQTVETAHGNPNVPFSVFKVTGMCRNELLEKISSAQPLSEEELAEYARLQNRVDRICAKGAATGTPIFIDAEETWMQKAIDDLVVEMMARYNKVEAIVYNTLQMYRHDRIAHLIEAYSQAEENDYIYAVKLVRGAYMEKERLRAEQMGYVSPIQPDKAATDRDYNAAISFCLDHLDRVAFCAGTHNEESSLFLADEIDRRGLGRKDRRIYFAQLFGMSDHISFNLSNAGFLVAKYVPYGPVKEVMPYLIRRAEENTSVAGQTTRELNLILKEIERRKQILRA
ncbi:proline dehydrogenase [Cryomorpha ignava]|uniref:Proline dehydrogenase n=1 Tax=Cryomorpha ignava TaxID=101383 RepID=A0A7K3WLT6_9FLAO|nr:proline dehydrogenase family protein [Cryomorpha ignava]NEN22424.1 proline dehydrogenase [Cryomorpha ignava]